MGCTRVSNLVLKHTTVLLRRVHNDILLLSNSGQSVVLLLLDLTAAFDTIDHEILLSRLEDVAGIQGSALKWFWSFLSHRSFSVNLGKLFSSSAPLICGVPQGSILGPFLFSLYILPLGFIVRNYGISFHFYADDTHMYMALRRSNVNALDPLMHCLNEVKAWMTANFLNFNISKTELIWFDGPTSSEKSHC